ncbi:MAG: tetratricopeptide repeat protein [Candidatus Riflebacteria bacterium]|nr:tetratricopeptide repeat protein [Candidatus Riflebacteria bacterium]
MASTCRRFFLVLLLQPALAVVAWAQELPPPPGMPLSDSQAGPAAPQETPSPSPSRLPLPREAPALAPTESVQRMFERFDLDRNGKLTPPECVRFARDASELPFDADGDGSVSPDEFLRAVASQNPSEVPIYLREQNVTMFEATKNAAANRAEEALGQYYAVIEKDPDSAVAALGAGRCLARMQRHADAVVLLQRAVTLGPELAEAWLDLGLSELRCGRTDAARADLWTGLRQMAVQAELGGGWNGSAAEKEHALAVCRSAAAQLRTVTGDSGLADRLATWAREHLESRPVAPGRDLPELGLVAVASHLETGRTEEALGEVRRLLVRRPRDWSLQLLEVAVLGLCGQHDLAAASLEEAAGLGAGRLPLAFARLANLLDRRLRAQALTLFAQCQIHHMEPWDMGELGWLLAYRGEWELALPYLEAMARQATGHPWLTKVLLAKAALGLGNRERARELLTQATDQPLAHPLLLEFAANLAFELDLPAQAVTAAAKAVELGPGDPVHWRLLARAQWDSGQREAAGVSLRKAWTRCHLDGERAALLGLVSAWAEQASRPGEGSARDR